MKKSIITLIFLGLLGNCTSGMAGDLMQDKEENLSSDNVPTVNASADESAEEPGGAAWLENFTFQLGTRLSSATLTDSNSGHRGGTYGSGTYLGTIYKLDEERDYAPDKVFGRIFYHNLVGLELAYDSLSARTKAASYGGTADKSDGTINAYGPTLSLVAQYPNKTPFTPYVQLGVGFFTADFDESAHWHLGYSNAEEWAEAGSPSTSKSGYTRRMELDDATALLVGIGCTYNVTDNWLIDLSALYSKYDIDGTFYGTSNGTVILEEEGSFPMDNYQIRLGVAYQF